MSGRTRNVQIPFRVTAEEKAQIEKNVSQLGTQNLSAYLRKMAINGYILHLDLPELPEMLSLLRNMSNNLNQLTALANMKQITVVYLDKTAEALTEISAAVRTIQKRRR